MATSLSVGNLQLMTTEGVANPDRVKAAADQAYEVIYRSDCDLSYLRREYEELKEQVKDLEYYVDWLLTQYGMER